MKTNIIFIIDESGSMSETASDVRGGFNNYVEQLRGDGNEYTLTAIKFGNRVRPLFANLTLDQVPKLTEKNYMPLDGTALYDAIGYGFAEAKKQWATEAHPYGADRVLFVVMTDGYENSSHEWSKDAVVAAMKAREDAGNWSFVYLGADQDAWAAASQIGFTQGNVLEFASCDTGETYQKLARATSTASSTSQTQTRWFFEPGRSNQTTSTNSD